MQISGIFSKIKIAVQTGGLFSVILITGMAHGAYNCTLTSSSNCSNADILSLTSGMASATTTSCYKTGTSSYVKLISETSCKSGWTPRERSVSTTTCSNGASIKYTMCECYCNNCTTSAWANVSGSSTHQSRTVGSCSCTSGSAQCTKTTQYRCRAGYYGSPSSSSSGCTKCTYTDGVAGTSDPDLEDWDNDKFGNDTWGNCWIAAGASASDSTGSYSYKQKCYFE